MHESLPIGALVAGGIIALVVWGICSAIGAGLRALFRRAPEQPIDEDGAAMAVVSRPVQMPGGQWMKRSFRWEPCDPPVQRGDIEIHDRQAPGHDAKTCKVCNERPTYSGASYRPIT